MKNSVFTPLPLRWIWTGIKWRNIHTSLNRIKKTPARSHKTVMITFHCLPFNNKRSGRVVTCFESSWVQLLLYVNSRQWHWSEERPPVGAGGSGALSQHDAAQHERGIFLSAVRRCNKWRRKGPRAQAFHCAQPLFFSPLVTVNNLGLRRFIALHSKRSRRNRRFMAKLLEQLGGCAAIKAEFLGASQDARYMEGIRALISLWQANISCSQGPCGGHIKPPPTDVWRCLVVPSISG